MAIFLRLLESKNKESALQELASELKAGAQLGERIFDIEPKIFRSIQGAPFSYWVNQSALKAFDSLPSFKGNSRLACVTNPVGEDKRFYRLWWEIVQHASTNGSAWVPLAKGGKFSPFYFDLNLVVNWSSADGTYVGFTGTEHRPLAKPASVDYFFKPGLSWPQRTSSGLGMRVLPTGAVFSTKGPGAFVHGFDARKTLAMLAICNSQPFKYLVNLQIAAADAAARSYEVGIINRTPFPETNAETEHSLATLAHEAWKAKRELDSVDETSHAFVLPAALRYRVGSYDPSAIETGLARIQVEIDVIAFDLYGFSDADRAAVQGNPGVADDGAAEVVKEFKSGTLTLGINNIGAAVASDLTGSQIDDNKVLVSQSENGGQPVAIGFRAKKSNGKYRYFWLYRVVFGIPATNLQTKGDNITFSTPSIEGTIIRRNKLDGQGKHPWKAELNEDDTSVPAATISGWYTQVYEPTFAAEG